MQRRVPRQGRTESKTSNVDLWLTRFSHASQIGLLVVAAFGYFYTVVPLYEKSLLDEQIAQKEIELKATKKALQENYELLRKDTIKEFIYYAGAECSGLFKRPKEPVRLGEKLESPVDRHIDAFDINISTCLADNLKSKRLKLLRPDDYEFFSQKVIGLGSNLEKFRASAKTDYLEFYRKASANPKILESLKPDSFTSNMLNTLQSQISESQYRDMELDAKLSAGLLELTTKYGNTLRDSISNLSNIKWPTPPT